MNDLPQNGQLFAGYQSGKQGAGSAWFRVTAVGIASPTTPTPPPCPFARYARAGYRWPQWEAQLSVENLTVTTTSSAPPARPQIMPGTPRRLHLTAAYRLILPCLPDPSGQRSTSTER